jgi:hypothetical protein
MHISRSVSCHTLQRYRILHGSELRSHTLQRYRKLHGSEAAPPHAHRTDALPLLCRIIFNAVDANHVRVLMVVGPAHIQRGVSFIMSYQIEALLADNGPIMAGLIGVSQEAGFGHSMPCQEVIIHPPVLNY